MNCQTGAPAPPRSPTFGSVPVLRRGSADRIAYSLKLRLGRPGRATPTEFELTPLDSWERRNHARDALASPLCVGCRTDYPIRERCDVSSSLRRVALGVELPCCQQTSSRREAGVRPAIEHAYCRRDTPAMDQPFIDLRYALRHLLRPGSPSRSPGAKRQMGWRAPRYLDIRQQIALLSNVEASFASHCSGPGRPYDDAR